MPVYAGWPAFATAVVIFIGGLFLGTHLQTSQPQSSAATRLQPTDTITTAHSPGSTVYVPVYSNLNLGLDIKQRIVELAATVSVRNTSPFHPIVIEWVRYHDSRGRRIRDFIDTPSALPPLSAVEFVIERADTSGGPGANVLVHWNATAEVDEPVIEAVMVGQTGTSGISFTSTGRTLNAHSPSGVSAK